MAGIGVTRHNAQRIEDATTRRHLYAMYFMGFYLIFKMFYIFGNGNAQPADIALAAVALFISPPHALLRAAREQFALAALIIWIIVVNTGWVLVLGKPDFLVSALYYVFNFLVVTAIFGARERDPKTFDAIFIRFLLGSIVLQFFFLRVGIHGSRAYGTFDNPNQLAYWTVSALSILLVLRRNRTQWWDAPFLLMALWCEIASASRAGMAAVLMLIAIWAWFALETAPKRIFGALFGILVAAALALTPVVGRFVENSSAISTAEQRATKQEQASQLDIRNYSRITQYFEYTVFGAGEGALWRFGKNVTGATLEIHSSFGTMFFSYGLIGILLFLSMLMNLMRKLPFTIGVYLLPSITYGVTHQGLRFSFFWILIGILMNMAASKDADAAGATEAPRTDAPVPRGWQERGSAFLLDVADARRKAGARP